MSARSKAEWVHAYVEQLRTQRKLSPHTLDAYRRDLAELAALSGETAWTALAQADVRRYAARLHGKALEPRSIARKLSSWRGFFDWLAGQTALAANPAQGVRAPKRAKSLPKALSVDDAVRLVSTAPRAHAAGGPEAALEPAELCNQAMFELLYSSGLRVSELVGLDLHYSKEALGWLEQGNADVTVLGKGNKRRTVPVGQAAMAAIAAWLTVRRRPTAAPRCLRARAAPAYRRARCNCGSRRTAWPPARRPACTRTCCATLSPRTCCNRRATCARCRTCWATPPSPPPRCTRRWTSSTWPRCTTKLIRAPK
jgi:integrase/recombinase XerC